jgi:type II secretory pathway component PulK
MATMTTVKVPAEVRDELRRRAEEQGVTQSEVIAAMLEATSRETLDVHTLFDEIDRDWAPLMERLAQ